MINEKKLSDRFPFWIFEDYPAREYEIGLGRKLFGKQRYAIKPIKGTEYNRYYKQIHDYKDKETATPWLNSINIYAKVYTLWNNGKLDTELLQEIVINITGESVTDLQGHMDRTLLADILHSEPHKVDNALKVLEI